MKFKKMFVQSQLQYRKTNNANIYEKTQAQSSDYPPVVVVQTRTSFSYMKQKQKLELLREQVTQKKQQKQMNKTATSLKSNPKPLNHNDPGKVFSQTMKASYLSQFPDNNLHTLLLQNKLESLEQKLKQKGIKTQEKFIQLKDEEVDEWKDVAVGWRIKLKKCIRSVKQRKQLNPSKQQAQQTTTKHFWNSSNTANNLTGKQPNLSSSLQSLSNQLHNTNQQPTQQRNIEEIIKKRKDVQIFVPICRQIEQLQGEQRQEAQLSQMPQQDQNVIIQSFMKVFQPRKGIIHSYSKQIKGGERQTNTKPEQQQQVKRIRWSKEVQLMESQFKQKNHKTYPKEVIVKQALTKQENGQDARETRQNQHMAKYCWKCFRKIDIKQNIGFRIENNEQLLKSPKYLCSSDCQQQYHSEVDELRKHFIKQNKNNIYGSFQRGQSQQNLEDNNEKDDEDGLQVIDLSIL